MSSERKPSGTWAPLPPPRNRAWEEASRGKDLAHPAPYAPSATYRVGEVILHPRFGTGIVQGVKEGGKIYVVFEDDTRVLAQGQK